MVVLFAHETTLYEDLKIEYSRSRTAILYVQIDNYDEVTQGLTEAEKTSLMLSVSEILEKWVESLSGFTRRVSDDLFLVLLEQRALNTAIEQKFIVLDQVRNQGGSRFEVCDFQVEHVRIMSAFCRDVGEL